MAGETNRWQLNLLNASPLCTPISDPWLIVMTRKEPATSLRASGKHLHGSRRFLINKGSGFTTGGNCLPLTMVQRQICQRQSAQMRSRRRVCFLRILFRASVHQKHAATSSPAHNPSLNPRLSRSAAWAVSPLKADVRDRDLSVGLLVRVCAPSPRRSRAIVYGQPKRYPRSHARFRD